MSAVPKFSDINKAANDIFSKDFPVGVVRVEVETKATDGVKFNVSGNRDNVTGGVSGELKHKYSSRDGLDVTTGINSSAFISNKIELKNAIVKGLKVDLESGLSSTGSKPVVKFGAEYKQDYLSTQASVDFLKGPIVSADAVVGSEGILLGGELAYDLKTGGLNKYSATLAYQTIDYTASLNALNSFNTFSAAYFHRLNSDVELAGKATLSNLIKSNNDISVELGTKWALDKTSFIKAKFDTVGKIGLSYRQQLRPGVKVTLGGLFDATRLNENAHKIGLGLSFEG